MQPTDSVVYVVEPCSSLRDRLVDRLASLDVVARSLTNADAFRLADKSDGFSCVILNPWYPNSNRDPRELLLEYDRLPVIVMSESASVSRVVEAMRAGANNVLTHSCSDADLLTAVTAAFASDREHRGIRRELARLRSRYITLTPREMEVLDLVVAGLLNKQSAGILGIREVTLQAHRCKVMEKMQAASLADLVRMADRLHLPPWSPSDSVLHLLRPRMRA